MKESWGHVYVSECVTETWISIPIMLNSLCYSPQYKKAEKKKFDIILWWI